MYEEADRLLADKEAKSALLRIGVLGLLYIAALVPTLVLRIQWMTIALSIAFGALLIFYWEMKVAPYTRYARFLRDMFAGLSRESTGEFVGVDADTVLRDGVLFHPLHMRVGQMEEDMRLYYFDDSKPLPEIEPGAVVHITSYGNFVKSIRVG